MENSSIIKRLSFIAFVMVVLAAWVVPGYSLDTAFDAQYRVRSIFTDNSQTFDDDDKTDRDSWIDQRFRLGIKLTEAPVSGYVQLQLGGNGQNGSRTWGSSDTKLCTNSTCTATATVGDTTSVIFRQAYLTFPLGPVGFTAGRTYASHGFLGGGMFENIADRFIISYKVSDELWGNFIHAKAREGSDLTGAAPFTSGANDNDKNIYNLGAIWKPKGRPYDAAARIYYVRDGASANPGPFVTGTPTTTSTPGTWDAIWLTGQTNMAFNPINVYLSAALLTGSVEPAGSSSVDLSGFAFHGDVNVNQGPFKAGVVAGLGSGDDGTSTDKLKTFFAPGAASYIQTHIFWQNGENTYAPSIAGTPETLSGVTWAGLYGDFKATPDLTLSAKIATFMLTDAPSGVDDSLGNEIDLTANYVIHKNLSLLAFAAWFTPGDAITGGVPPDDKITEYFARLQWEL